MNTLAVRKVAITRSREGNAELGPRLEAMGLEVIPMDLIAFLPPESWNEVDSRLRRLQDFDWLVFTSSTGVRFFADRMKHLGIALSGHHQPKVGAVGKGTAGALATEGVRVDFTPSRYQTSALADQLPEPAGRVLLLRADIAEKSVVSTLSSRGFSVEDVPIYRTRALEPHEVDKLLEVDIVVFASPSAVDALCSQIPRRVLSELASKTAACIGPVTAAAARRHGFRHVLEPRANTFDSLLEEIRRETKVA